MAFPPLSLYIFILVIEPLNVDINANDNIKGIKTKIDQCKIGQYADDTFLLPEGDDSSLQECLKTFHDFYCSSGLKMNMQKTEAAWIGTPRYIKKV